MTTILERLVASRPWMEDALCAQVDTELFYPEKGGSTRNAKQTCMACPVREQCLDFALENDERHGIWGGASERERRVLARERGIERQPVRHPAAISQDHVRGMYARGLNDVEIARELDCHPETVLRVRHRLGLAANKTYTRGDVSA